MGLTDTIQPAQEQPLRAGLVFTPAFKMMITGRSYIVPIVVEMDTVIAPLINALNLTADVSWSMEHMNKSYPIVNLLSKTLDNFQEEFDKMFKETVEYLSSISGRSPHGRPRRGAINLLGQLANLLFGVATQKEVDNIHNQLNDLNHLSEEERKTLNVHTEILNITVRDLRHIHSAIDKLEAAANNTANIIRHFSIKTSMIEEELRMLETIALLQLALSDLNHDLTSMKLGFQEMLDTYASTFVIPDAVFLNILKEASLKLPGLLFPAEPEFLSVYRDISTVYTRQMATGGYLCFYLLIPMKGDPADVFDIFRMSSLPYPLQNSSYFVETVPASKYLAVTEDRNAYMLIEEFDKCRQHDSLFICPPVGPVYTTNTPVCEIALFLDYPEAVSLCPKRVVQQFRPHFYRLPDGWAYSVDRATTLTMVCPSNALTKAKQEVSGTGVLYVGPSCAVHSEAFSLPALDTVVDEVPLSIRPAPLPIAPLLTGWEKDVVDVLPHSALSAARDNAPVALDLLAAQLVPIDRPLPRQLPHSMLPWWSLVAFGAAITVGLAVTATCVYRRTRARLTSAVSSAQIQTLTPEEWTYTLPRPSKHITRGRVILGEGVCREPQPSSETSNDNPEQ